jgi:glutamate-1-semialdehyde 2,1-aminomutase
VRVVAIVQARMGSVRLPGKVMRPVMNVPLIELLLSRLARARRVDAVVVATPAGEADAPLAGHVRRLGYACHEGSECDVLERILHAAERFDADVIVRITGDCPLVDPALVDAAVEAFTGAGVEYLSNLAPPTYPDGLDVEVFTRAALARADREATTGYDREHVTPYLRESGRFRTMNMAYDEDCSTDRWTVDQPEDFEVVAHVFRHFHPRVDFGWLEVLALARAQPQLFVANRHLRRNHGAVRPGNGAPQPR